MLGTKVHTANMPSDRECNSKAAVTTPGLQRSMAAEETKGCTHGHFDTATREEA
jgi:hypothetical protein